jgi:hypothetical protein
MVIDTFFRCDSQSLVFWDSRIFFFRAAIFLSRRTFSLAGFMGTEDVLPEAWSVGLEWAGLTNRRRCARTRPFRLSIAFWAFSIVSYSTKQYLDSADVFFCIRLVIRSGLPNFENKRSRWPWWMALANPVTKREVEVATTRVRWRALVEWLSSVSGAAVLVDVVLSLLFSAACFGSSFSATCDSLSVAVSSSIFSISGIVHNCV